MIKLCLIILVALTACSKEKNEPPKTTIGLVSEVPVDIRPQITILAAGQSNMAGYGMKDHPFPSSDRIEVIGNVPLVGNYGPAYAYAMQVIRTQNVKILIIQCSVGGSSIESWQPGNTNFSRCSDYWKSRGSPPISVILWMQGEAEAMSNKPEGWSGQFEYAISSLRSIVGSVPVVYAQIGPNPASPETESYHSWKSIQEQQEMLSIPNSYMVKTSDLSLSDNWVHFDVSSYDTIGKRMFYKKGPS